MKNVTVPYYQNESQDTSQALCGRSLVSTTVSTNPSCSTAQIDVAAFEQTTRELVGRAANMKTRFWLKFCVVWPLGPQDIRRIHRENINFNKRRCEYLTFNNTPTAYLLIDSDGDPEYTKNIIRRKLGSAAAPSPPILLAAPNSGYAIRFRHGEEMPTLIQKSSESQFALVFDEKYTEFTKCSARVFYERLLRCPLRFDRKLEQSEKLWIQKNLKRNDLAHRAIRVLEFYSIEERNEIVGRADNSIKFLDALFCDTMQFYREAYEDLNLYIKYSNTPKHIECVSVTVRNESDKKHAESSFTSHGLSVLYFNRKMECDPAAKYDITLKTMVLQNFPRHLVTYESREWFVRRIAKENFFQLQSVNSFVQWQSHAKRCCFKAKNRDFFKIINFAFYKIAHINRIYHPIDAPWIEELQGGLGARSMMSVVLERPDVPWQIARERRGAIQEDELFTIYFKNVTVGMQLIEHVIRIAGIEPIFRTDAADRDGPQLVPFYRRSFTVTRAARAVVTSKLRQLDAKLRATFCMLTKQEDPIMMQDDAQYYVVRIFEEWTPNSKSGVIGVHGWSQNAIQLFATQILEIMSPKEFSTENCPEMTFGIGEQWVKSLQRKYHVLLDVDKYREVISVLGDDSEEVLKELETYSQKKSEILVASRIPCFFPHLNDRVRCELLSPGIVEKIRRQLGAQKLYMDRESQCLDFQGSLEAYEKLIELLETLSNEVFKRETRNREAEEIPNLVCPICTAETGISNDFYRLECGHVMCRTCINTQIRSRIDEQQFNIRCEIDGCHRVLTPAEIMNIILGGSDRMKELDTQKLRRLTDRAKQLLIQTNEDLAACPSADCVGILSKSDDGLISEFKKCEACDRSYCRKCLAEPHPDDTCEEFARIRRPEDSIARYQKDMGSRVKKCPKCAVLVEKREGCNHMQCGCGTHYCWTCLYVAESSGDCYRHMQAEHGGHGGEIDMNQLPDNEPGIQQAMLQQYRAPRAEDDPMFFDEHGFTDDDDSDADADDEAFVAAIYPQQHANRDQFANYRRNAAAFEEPPAPPPPPPPPQYIRDLPQLLIDTFPTIYGDPETRVDYVDFVNSAQTQDQLEANLVMLYQNAEEHLAVEPQRRGR